MAMQLVFLFFFCPFIEGDLIILDLANTTLYFYQNGNPIYEFPVGVGKLSTPTPRGVGRIYEKREEITFRYGSGPRRGKKIRWSRLSDGEVIRMPYNDMRALAIDINGKRNVSIHSTTEDDSIGKKISKGCIRIKIPDLLILFPLVKKGTSIIIF